METWKPIPGFDGYEVSDLGRVRSVDREIVVDHRGRGKTWRRRYRGRILKPSLGPHGYLRVRPGWHANAQYVAQLVMLAFIGEPPVGHEVAHNNGKNTDNRLSNLRYDTPSGNNADKLAHGTHNRGDHHPFCRLNPAQASHIFGSELPRHMLAKYYGISVSHVDNIRKKRSWGWLNG